jgi:hypothetical protein
MRLSALVVVAVHLASRVDGSRPAQDERVPARRNVPVARAVGQSQESNSVGGQAQIDTGHATGANQASFGPKGPRRDMASGAARWNQDAFFISFWVGPQVAEDELDARFAEIAEANFTG